MKITDTQLPSGDELVNKAFDFAYAYHYRYFDHIVQYWVDQNTKTFDLKRQELEDNLKDELVSPDSYADQMADIDYTMANLRPVVEEEVRKQLDSRFDGTYVAPAEIVLYNAENPSPLALAAALVMRAILTPQDWMDVKNKLGDEVAEVVKNVLHADRYKLSDPKLIPALDPTEKTVLLGMTYLSIVSFVQGVKEDLLMRQFEQLFGNDAKFDEAFINHFNMISASMSADCAIKIEGGKPVLRYNSQPGSDASANDDKGPSSGGPSGNAGNDNKGGGKPLGGVWLTPKK